MVDQTNKDERYKARQQKVKDEVDARVEAAQEEKGLFLIITGNGKGKTTSGFGTIARAVGTARSAALVSLSRGPGIAARETCLNHTG